jgi:hypothetical protein
VVSTPSFQRLAARDTPSSVVHAEKPVWPVDKPEVVDPNGSPVGRGSRHYEQATTLVLVRILQRIGTGHAFFGPTPRDSSLIQHSPDSLVVHSGNMIKCSSRNLTKAHQHPGCAVLFRWAVLSDKRLYWLGCLFDVDPLTAP